MSDLHAYLKQFGRQMRLRDAGLLAQRWLWLAAAIAGLVQLGGRFRPVPDLWLWTLLPFAAWLVLVVGWGLFAPRSPMQIARRTDLEAGLKERLSTALAFEQNHAGWKTPQGELLIHLQQADALEIAHQVSQRRIFYLTWLRRPLAAAALILIGTIALAVLPNPMSRVIAERAEVKETLAEQSRNVEELAQEIQNEQALSPEDRDKLLRQLAELAQQLRENPGDREQALADFARLEENLRRQVDPNLESRQAALSSLADQLQALAQNDQNSQSKPAELDQALQQLAEQLAEMDPGEQQALAQSLADLAAQAAQAGQPTLAQALSSMAQSALSGDSQSASQSAQAASQALSQASQDMASQQALSQALSQLQASRQAVAQAGQGQQVAQGNSQSGSQGQNSGQNSGQGQNPGTGQNPGQGQTVGGGGGTNANTLPPARRQGRAGSPQGPGLPATAGQLDDQVYVPFETAGTNGEQVFIAGQDTGQGDTQVREGQDPLPGTANPALVPYQQVYSQYLQAANQAVESGYIPPELKDYIKSYFTQLEP
jgi:hypothetical protein